MAITVELESLTTKSRFVTPTYADRNGTPSVISSELPMPTADISTLRTIEGRSYAIGVVNSFAAPLAAGASINIAVAWASGVKPSISVSGLCGGDAMWYLYEGAVVAGGSPLTAVNINRNYSATLSQSAILVNPTVTSTGTTLLEQILIGGTGKKAGGADMHSARLVLKPLTTYLFRLTNVNGTAHAAEMILEWYE
jgi:hypothetical protein